MFLNLEGKNDYFLTMKSIVLAINIYFTSWQWSFDESNLLYKMYIFKICMIDAHLTVYVAFIGFVAEQFLNNTATQLTYHGLCELTSAVQEGELCVFFRNNHFSTMTKYKVWLLMLHWLVYHLWCQTGKVNLQKKVCPTIFFSVFKWCRNKQEFQIITMKGGCDFRYTLCLDQILFS